MHTAQKQNPATSWEDVREQLQSVINEQAFDRWFASVVGNIEPTEASADVLRLVAPNQFHAECIRDRYSSMIEAIWREMGQEGRVVFATEEVSEPPQQQQTLETAQLPAKVIQFPLFPNETRPFSNDMARSALFSCVQGKDRKMVKDELLAAQDGIEIRFTGERFNQDDHDLLMQLVAYAKHTPLGEYVTVPAHAILQSLGRNTDGRGHERLRADITRLVAGTASLRNTKLGMEYIGHLIEKAIQAEISRHWVYKFNPDLRMFYNPHAYTLIDWKQRKRLKGKNLARWLQLFIASHAAPFPVSVAYLREKSGSQTAELRKFRQLLKTALNPVNSSITFARMIALQNDERHLRSGL